MQVAVFLYRSNGKPNNKMAKDYVCFILIINCYCIPCLAICRLNQILNVQGTDVIASRTRSDFRCKIVHTVLGVILFHGANYCNASLWRQYRLSLSKIMDIKVMIMLTPCMCPLKCLCFSYALERTLSTTYIHFDNNIHNHNNICVSLCCTTML